VSWRIEDAYADGSVLQSLFSQLCKNLSLTASAFVLVVLPTVLLPNDEPLSLFVFQIPSHSSQNALLPTHFLLLL